jgi:hypothetical protein
METSMRAFDNHTVFVGTEAYEVSGGSIGARCVAGRRWWLATG